MLDSDMVRIRHMLDAARDAVNFATGKSREDLDEDRMLVLALIKSIEIIGEAANIVTTECREKCPKIAWLDIIGMRNRLIHAYFDINVDIVWDTVTNELPPLITSLDNIVNAE